MSLEQPESVASASPATPEERPTPAEAAGEAVRVLDAIPLLKEATDVKVKGNDQFKRKQFNEAVKVYQEGLDILSRSDMHRMAADEKEQVDALKSVFWSNIAACRLQQQLFDRAVDAATECLKFDKNNTKALLRRSQAHEKLGQLEEALSDSAKLKKLGDGHLTEKESEAEEKRRERLWETLQQNNRDIDDLAKANEPYWKMKQRFDDLVDKYDLGDGQFFLLVARWLIIDECFDKTVETVMKHWKMNKSDAEFGAKWVKLGLETHKNSPDVKAIYAAAHKIKKGIEEEKSKSGA